MISSASRFHHPTKPQSVNVSHRLLIQLVVLSLAAILLQCDRTVGLESKMARRFEEGCKKKVDCQASIRDLTDFTWDKMYIFLYNANPEEINRALGMVHPPFEEFTTRFVFMDSGRIVHEEAQPIDIEHVSNGEVVFELGDRRTWDSYPINEAVFQIEKVEQANGCYYKAIPKTKPN